MTAMAAVAAGIAAILAGKFDHRCTLTLHIAGTDNDEAHFNAYRRELLDLIWLNDAARTGATREERWQVHADAAHGILQAASLAPDVAAGRSALDTLTDAYYQHLAEVVRKARESADAARAVAAVESSRMRSELDSLLARSGGTDPTGETNPLNRREALARSFASHRADYHEIARELAEAVARLDTLKAAPAATLTRPDPDARRRELQADTELTQDLKALEVHLADLKSQLLAIQQTTSPLLDELTLAADCLSEIGRGDAAKAASDPYRVAAETIADSAGAYQQLLATFLARWTREFNSLREGATDPQLAGVVDSHERLNRLLGDFLFGSVEPLGVMHDQLETLGSNPAEAARHHELVSTATRCFHRLRTNHHKFEFTAGDLKSVNNFRLDAALKSARGLYRRTQERVRMIDERLEKEAAQAAADRRQDEMHNLQKRIEELHRQASAHVDAMLDVQDQLSQTSGQVDDYIRTQSTTELRAQRVRELEGKLQSADTRLAGHDDDFQASVNPAAVTVVDKRVDPKPVNLLNRLATGWLVTASALLILLLGQWAVSRRSGG